MIFWLVIICVLSIIFNGGNIRCSKHSMRYERPDPIDMDGAIAIFHYSGEALPFCFRLLFS